MASRSSNSNTMVYIQSLCRKLCQSLVVKLILLIMSLYFGGLIWFFYAYATDWTQLYHLCYQSSAELITTIYYDYEEYSPLFMVRKTSHIDKCDAHDITCEMKRQKQQHVLFSKSNKHNRDYCIKNVRDEEYHERQIPQTLIDKHKHNPINKLLFDLQAMEASEQTLSMLLSINELKSEFSIESRDCASKSSIYLTSFSPVLGFHVLCIYHFADYSQSLIIVYQHGYNKAMLPSIPYKNRKRCVVRNILGSDKSKKGKTQLKTKLKTQEAPNGTYYVTNECERVITPQEANPKAVLITMKSMKSFRRHLQNHIINDIASYDQYTIEGWDISKDFVKDNIDPYQRYYEPTFDPTKSPETDKLYDRLQSLRAGKKQKKTDTKHKNRRNTIHSAPYTQKIDPFDGHNKNTKDNNTQATVISQYKKNPFAIYYPNGESVAYQLSGNELFSMKRVMFMFEGGRFMWPGVQRGHVITLPIGPNVKLKTLNMRPLIFEISGLITNGEVEYIQNKSLPRFNRSEVGLNEEKKVSDSRTCESAWLFGEQDVIVKSLKNRCQRIVQIPVTHMEDMEVVRYKKGERFDMHYDAFQSHDAASVQSQLLLHGGFKNRIATILYYLSDVEQDSAGYTVFPRFDDNLDWDDYGIEKLSSELILTNNCCNDTLFTKKYALRIRPKSGKTILFYNMLANGELDINVIHGGCTLQSGQKWAANQWIWNRPFGQ